MRNVVIGIDVGGSTTKIVGFDENKNLISPLFVKATDQIFPSNGACNELCLAAPDQIVGMNVKTDDGRTRAALQGTTLCHLQQRGVSDMDAVEKADRDHAMECFHDHTS